MRTYSLDPSQWIRTVRERASEIGNRRRRAQFRLNDATSAPLAARRTAGAATVLEGLQQLALTDGNFSLKTRKSVTSANVTPLAPRKTAPRPAKPGLRAAASGAMEAAMEWRE